MSNLHTPTVLLLLGIVYVNSCYWNSQCQYQLYGSKTPYDVVRGDIRDSATPSKCQAVSVWSLHRHGNRNPGNSVTEGMKEVSLLKDEIIASYELGKSRLCAQDIENLKKWKWNTTLEYSQSYLTGKGYEELFGIGARLREKFPELFFGAADQYYFRPTNEQRTITSCAAFVHGFTNGTNLEVTVDDPLTKDDILRPYQFCERYQREVKGGENLEVQLESFFKTPVYFDIQNAVQKRLGIETNLTAANVFSIYEMCRFQRSWSPDLKNPWCSAFTDSDLIVLEYYDDVRHYYRNGYGSWINERLGRIPMKDLYDNFKTIVEGEEKGKKVVSYFSHDTMLEMVFSALGLFKEDAPLHSLVRDPLRKWRTSYIGAFSVNIIAVLNRCYGVQSPYRIQIYINENETPLCPSEGCTWLEFKDMFDFFTNSKLDFCKIEEDSKNDPFTNRAQKKSGFWRW